MFLFVLLRLVNSRPDSSLLESTFSTCPSLTSSSPIPPSPPSAFETQIARVEKEHDALEEKERTVNKAIRTIRVRLGSLSPRFELIRVRDKSDRLGVLSSFLRTNRPSGFLSSRNWSPTSTRSSLLRWTVSRLSSPSHVRALSSHALLFFHPLLALDDRGEIRIRQHEGKPTISPPSLENETER